MADLGVKEAGSTQQTQNPHQLLGNKMYFCLKKKILEAQAWPPEVAQRRVRVSRESLRGELKQGVERSPS